MLDDLRLLVEALADHVRVNLSTRAVEIYDDYGVKTVLHDLDAETFETFKKLFVNF